MKNIHILKTDKPSRLWINNLLQGKLELHKELLIGSNTAQQIYITSNNFNKISDEGVHHNSGDWLLDTINNKIFQASINIISEDDIQKIILTTDQDLIKDCVQAIDIEFLEWFVKNPSCEEVFITNDFEQVNQDNPILRGSTNVVHKYKIIIPKEEPKKNWYCAKCESYVSSESVTFEETHQICNTGVIIEEDKQETLEEALNNYIAKKHTQEECVGFIDGFQLAKEKTIEEVFEWLTTNNYLTDLKETLINNFKNK
jgi:hypothetical protein